MYERDYPFHLLPLITLFTFVENSILNQENANN